jgi:hypothetical protein
LKITASPLLRRVAVLVLPAAYVIGAFFLRDAAGPFWMWYSLDPDYFYVLDSLNLALGQTPGHVHHPGTPVQVLGAVVMRAMHGLADADALTASVLAHPEGHLITIFAVITVVNGLAMAGLGLLALRPLGALAAVLLQAGPFLSRVVFKHVIEVKPEPLLVLAMIGLLAVAVAALRPGAAEERPYRFAFAFAVVAGFAVACKVTAAPVFVLPLVVLPGWGPRAAYAGFALVSLITFTLPMAGSYDVFLAWMAKVAAGSGAYGAGSGAVDLGAYPKHLYKLFSRPLLGVSWVLSLVVLAVAWRRRHIMPPGPEARLLAGVAVAQLCQALVVAKQPTAYYMLPAWMVVPLSWVLMIRLAESLELRLARPKARFRGAVWALALVLAVAQTAAIARAAGEFEEKRRDAFAVDDGAFAACTRAYFYAASSRAYGLLLADHVTGGRFGARLPVAPGTYILENWWDTGTVTVRGPGGPVDLAAEARRRPCLFIRGLHPHAGPIREFLARTLPGASLDRACSTRDSLILTAGADCRGRPSAP